jgi:tetratricopeptide (TPR) repeat protein
MPKPYDLLFWALFIAIIVATVLMLWVTRVLRERHSETYHELELDNWLRDSGSGALVGFVWRREYVRLRDPAVTRVCDALRVLLAGIAIGFAALFGYARIGDFAEHGTGPAMDFVGERREAAYGLHRRGRYAEAIAIYDELLGSIGNDAEMVYYRGNARASLKRYDEALVDYRRVMDLDPGKFDAYLNADRILSHQRRFDDCVDLWNRYLRIVPGDASAHMERGGSHFHRGDFASAYADATRACELGKKDACPLAEQMKAKL